MSDYRIEKTAEAFSVSVYGVALGDFNDWTGNAKLIAAHKAALIANGELASLKRKAANDLDYVVNDVVDGKPWRGFGVEGVHEGEGIRVVTFPAGEYLVVAGSGTDGEKLAEEILGKVFGGVLQQATDYQYVGGGNATYVKANGDGTFSGETWIPVVRK